jgi:cupin 2 domain-containing protein
MSNIFDLLPGTLEKEAFSDLVKHDHVRIERILSKGHTSPDAGWYDQDENEWVIVLKGSGRIVFEDGIEIQLNSGDYLNIPVHSKHKVKWTDPNNVTVWLAVFY